jgi:DNA polymerase-3 subunit alpha
MYIPLRNFTKYTISESILEIKSWIKLLAEHKIPAAACTDKANLFGMVQFYKMALQAKIKPLLGAQFLVQLPHSQQTVDCVFIAKNYQGYVQLSSLISDYYKYQERDKPLSWSLLEHYTVDLIAIIHQNDLDSLMPYLTLWKKLFPERLLIGIERYPDQKLIFQKSQQALRYAHEHQLPPVVANSVYFLYEEDFETQQIKSCIQQGHYLDDPKRPVLHHRGQRFFSPEEMKQLFQDCPQVLENSLVLAKKCTVELTFGKTLLPKFAENEERTLSDLAYEGLEERKKRNHCIQHDEKKYLDRLETELKVICSMGFSGYFLIVSEFIRWAKDNLIPVGPGRGSGAGSLVAYVLKITDLDPLQYDLLFERFLNPERVSMPDFDVDFCMKKRDDVIKHVQDLYGAESVSQIATFGTMAAKAVIRDVGRVLHHPFPFVDKIAKMIPLQLGITLSESLEKSEELKKAYEEDEVVTQLIDYALKLEGLPRNVGKHAGGVVIAPQALKTICPLYNETHTAWHPITQLDKDDGESIGLIKFDFLGLKTLTVIDWTYEYSKIIGQNLVPLEELPLDDKKSFELLGKAETVAVFQLESRGMRDLIKNMKPDCFEDIIALVALFRPGPLQSGMVDDFIDRKHGRSSTLYPHPLSEAILKPTYGVILYQEQVMQLAQTLAGYTLGGADLLRRAMGKKKPEEMALQRNIFVQGAIVRGIDESTASFVFDLMEKFAEYGFNKSHSAVYALIAFQTLYLKAHAPAAFMAANMTAEEGNLEKILILVEDARSFGIEVYPPCINRSAVHFRPLDEKSIAFGLGSVKGIGPSLLLPVIKERQEHGPFNSFEDFIARVSPLGLTKKTIELLIKVGAFDQLHTHRKSLLIQQLPKFYSKYDQHYATQKTLFEFDELVDDLSLEDYLWSEQIDLEVSLLGFAISGSLLDPYLFLKQPICKKGYIIGEQTTQPTLVLVHGLREILTAKGTKFIIAQLVLATDKLEVILNPTRERDQETLLELKLLIEQKKPGLAIFKTVEGKNKKQLVTLMSIIGLDTFLKQQVKNVVIRIPLNTESLGLNNFLKNLPSFHYGCTVEVYLYTEEQDELIFKVQSESRIGLLSTLIEKAYTFKNELKVHLT